MPVIGVTADQVGKIEGSTFGFEIGYRILDCENPASLRQVAALVRDQDPKVPEDGREAADIRFEVANPTRNR